MRMRTILIMLLACTLLTCSLIAQRDEQAEAPPAPTPPPTIEPPAYFGEESIEERIAKADIVVTARLDRTTTEVATTTAEHWSGKYYPALRFHLTVSEYLNGSGANSITVLTVQGVTYDTEKEAEDAAPGIVATRDATWDDREAILFLTEEHRSDIFSASVQGANDYYLATGGPYQDMYSLHNRYRKLWLPSAGTPATGDDQEFLLAVPEPNIDTPTITLGELKRRITAVNAKLNAGDGSDAYKGCIAATYQSERQERVRMSGSSAQSRNFEPTWDGTFAPGQPAGAEVYKYDPGWAQPAEKKSQLWLDGRDAALFAVKLGDLRPGPDRDRDGQSDGFEFDQSVVSARPLPAGTYEFNHNVIPWFYLACERTVTFAITENVTAPSGVLHEMFFDPVAVGSTVAADDTNGVLKPATFTDANGASSTLSSISYESGTVKVEVTTGSGSGTRPDDALSGHVLDFIELDGTVSLSLDVGEATVDAPNDTLSWSVESQPWKDGDLLMVRVYELTATTCADPSAAFGACNPTFSSPPYAFTVSEDAAVGDAVGSVSATSSKPGAVVSYSITAGNDDGFFVVDANIGEITVAGALDYETTTEYTLTIEASDGSGGKATTTVQVVVEDVYEPNARCLNGATVLDPNSNADLVRDCTHLLQGRDTLAGTGTLNWSKDIAITAWDGVHLTSEEDAVGRLLLEAVSLTGSIPASLGNLTSLKRLDLDDNQLSGPISASHVMGRALAATTGS